MPIRLVLGGLAVLVACGRPSHDESTLDGGIVLTDAEPPIDTSDGRSDVPDLTPASARVDLAGDR